MAEVFQVAGYDARHVRDYGMATASDEEILRLAQDEDRVIVSADTDFGMLLARQGTDGPSILLYRRQSARRPAEQAAILLINLPAALDALTEGSIVTVDETRLRIRRLPIGRGPAD